MSPLWKRFGSMACAALRVAPVAWLLTRGAGTASEAAPAGSGGPRSNPLDAVRREALDEAARAEGENALRRIREKWRLELEAEEKAKAAGRPFYRCGYCSPGLFAMESKGERTELRLLALGYPEVAEAWATRAAQDPKQRACERRSATWVLGYLAEARVGNGNGVLVQLCTDSDDAVRWLAQYLLAKSDRSGFHRDLFRALAREGESQALEVLANWPDQEAATICKEVLKRGLNQGETPFAAKAALERMKAVDSGTWQALAQKTILEESLLYSTCHFWWALRIAGERRVSWQEKTLRERLEKDYGSGLIRLEGERPEMRSDAADDIFLALAEMGATLTESEEAYLRRFGYLCEPRRRLRELLDERTFPK